MKISYYIMVVVVILTAWSSSGGVLAQSLGSEEFVFVDSGRREIQPEELLDLNAAQLRQARNEIFARKGYRFSKSDIRKQFQAKTYYQPMRKSVDLNPVETKNVVRIREFEAYFAEYPEAAFEVSYQIGTDEGDKMRSVEIRSCPESRCPVIGTLQSGCSVESDIRISVPGWVYVKSSTCGRASGSSGGYVPVRGLALVAG